MCFLCWKRCLTNRNLWNHYCTSMEETCVYHEERREFVITLQTSLVVIKNESRVIDLSGHLLLDRDFQLIFQVFRYSSIRSALEVLILSNNRMTCIGIQYLAEYLKKGFPVLNRIELSGNHLGDNGVKTFYYSLRSSLLDVCPVIQTINLGSNGITNSSVNIMQKWILRTNGSLSFTFDHNPIDGMGVALMMRSKYWESFQIDRTAVIPR